MNDFLLKFNKIKKSIINFLKINPHRHWVFLLYTFFVLVSLLILFSLYLLYKIKNEQIFQVKVEQTKEQNLINESLLKKTINIYDNKVKKESDIKNGVSSYKDPSI